MGDRVEGASLGSLVPAGPHELTGPTQHVVRSPACEREEQYPIRWHLPVEEAGQPGSQRPGLAGAGTGDDHEGGIPVRRHCELGLVQPSVPGRLVSEHMFVE